MSHEFLENYQYDGCVARGICSIGPITSALQSALIMYLKFIAKYIDKIEEKGVQYEKLKSLVLNLLPISVSYPEFTESSFMLALYEFHNVINTFDNKVEVYAAGKKLFEATSDIVNSIRYGERVFLRAQERLSLQVRDLYNIMLVIAKSLAVNLLDLESFGKSSDNAFKYIINILNEINLEEKNIENLKTFIFNASKIDNKLMFEIRNAQENCYGKQREVEVSFSTVPSKAVLVVGSNIKELENVLENLKNTSIDVYTHDDMMLAHTFPKFTEYVNLKGQFGQGVENCLLDFATFPGPIILTKHSLHNIDNLYRGILFTTDFTCPKGVVRIIDNDFSQVIKLAQESKGFKTGKQCEEILVGCDYYKKIEEIKSKLMNYKKLVMIAVDGYSLEQKVYFEKLLKNLPEDVLVVSFSYESTKENVIYLNTCYDAFGLIKVFEEIKDLVPSITIFIPRCDKNSVSQMVYLKSHENTTVFVGKCTPIILNPSLMQTFQDEFSINAITSAKKDLDIILKN